VKYIAALGIVSLLALTGCGNSTDRDTEKALTMIDDQILMVGNGAEPEGLDPHIVTGVPEHHLLVALFEGLVGMNPEDLSPIPAVAESWDVSDDQKVYTFHIRETAKWSNGEPLTAKDFTYAWKRMLTPTLAAEYSYMLYSMKNARAYKEGTLKDFEQVGCRVIDDHTVEVTLDNPTPYFLQLHIHYSWFPVHQATIEAHGKFDERNTPWTRPENIVSNGPFNLADWRPNDVMEMRTNPHYWDRANIKLKGVNFYPVPDEQTEDRMFRAADLHVTENVLVPRVPVWLRENPSLIRTDPWIGSYFYRVNIKREPFGDPKVRLALAMAVDRDSITSKILHGGETSAGFLTPPNVNGFTATASIPYDPEAAKALLAEAGYPNGEGFPTFALLYNTAEKHKIIAVAIQEMWRNTLNIDVQIENQDWKVYLSNTSNETMNYDVARAGWIGDFVDPINFLECFTTGNGNNRTGWSNAEYDALVEESFRTADPTARYELFQKAELILTQEAPIIPIYHYTKPFLIAPEVKNFIPNILGYMPYHTYWLETPK